jgi:D-alanine transaminase
MESLACLNGELLPVEEARVPIWDRGFLFGDSVYEMLRIYSGRCWLEESHMARLRRSLAAMQFPQVGLDALADRMRQTIDAAGIREGTAYIQITRGVAPRRHAFPDPPAPPTELIVIQTYDDGPTARLRENGVGVISQPDLRWKRCDVKSTNLLANVLANEAAHRAGCYEAVLVGSDGLVTEATHSSLVWARRGLVGGTPEGPGILPGTTRKLLLRLAEEIRVPFEESHVTVDGLLDADEVLLLGTTIEVLPVKAIDGRQVSDGRPGPVTRRLQAAFRAAVERWLASEPV